MKRRVSFYIDDKLALELEMILLDKAKGRSKYGLRTYLLERLIREWVNKMKNRPSGEK